MLDIESVFSAESQALWDLLAADRGCEIPSYQRPYAWDVGNVDRLLEDIVAGMAELADNSDAVRFIGSVITVGRKAPDEPRNRLIIIDGQQRLCTILVLNALLHEQLGRCIAALDARDDQRLNRVLEQTEDLRESLSRTYEREARRTGDIYRMFPRIIRIDDDVWSRKAAHARYESPIARFLWSYISHVHGDESDQPFAYSALDANDRILQGHEALVGVISALGTALTCLADGAYGDLELPELPTLRCDDAYVSELWDGEPPPAELDALLADDEDKTLHRLLRLSALARFVNYRTAATVVEATAEDYAFDMFEAMNTTGQPLTAFETLKPKIAASERGAYVGSLSHAAVKRVDRYLDRFDRADERQAVTSTLLIPFALLENGFKLERHLSRQRKYLRRRYEDASNLAKKRAMVTALADLSEFVDNGWQGELTAGALPGSSQHDDEAAFCLAALRDIRHEIVLAPLARFYSAHQEASGAAKAAAAADYFAAIKAIAAFSMLWRANFAGTAGIDSAYRELMAKGGGGAPKLSRENPAAPSIDHLKTFFRWKLARKNIDRAHWIASASSEVAYRSGQQSLLRFLLLAASHDTVPANGNPGYLEVGIPGVQPMMTLAKWMDETTTSIEHVAPQSYNSAGWPTDLYDNPRTVNQMGNLILMPSAENTVLSNRPWLQKQILFKLFGASTQAEVQAALTSAQASGFNPGKKVDELLASARFLSMCSAIKDFPGPWDKAWVELRSRHLAELAWDRLWAWLQAPAANPATIRVPPPPKA